MRRLELTRGTRFGDWAVLGHPVTRHLRTYWQCLCTCGTTRLVSGSDLKSGASRSCGCQRTRATRKHGMGGTPTYYSWYDMRRRCLDPLHKAYKNYGARGVAVCARWSEFGNFLHDMGIKPDGLSLDRVDNGGNYEPGNCEWASNTKQANNRRSNIFLEVGGCTKTLAQWCDHLGLSRIRIYQMYRRTEGPRKVRDTMEPLLVSSRATKQQG